MRRRNSGLSGGEKPPPVDDSVNCREQLRSCREENANLRQQVASLKARLKFQRRHYELRDKLINLWRATRDELIAEGWWTLETHSRFCVYLPLCETDQRPYLDSRHLFADSDQQRNRPDFSNRSYLSESWHARLALEHTVSVAIDLTDTLAIARLRLGGDLLHRLVEELGYRSMLLFPLGKQADLPAVFAIESRSPMSDTKFAEDGLRERLASLPNSLRTDILNVYEPREIGGVVVIDRLLAALKEDPE